ncbi:MAG: hypothetical protein NDI61_11755, partial [Bdellovibrionaceae bacterium]|nr:hypothetical protein [Pseudobdellovibrionaceae bacterium]
EKLRQASRHFKSVTYDPSSRRLSIVAEALGLQVRSVLRMEPVSGTERDEVRWEVVEGDFQGMRGALVIERADQSNRAESAHAESSRAKSARAEVSIDSIYEARELPLPRILMGWTLEAIVQKAAERIRSMAEQEYRLKNAG